MQELTDVLDFLEPLLRRHAQDAWHFRKGYVGNSRVAEAYLYEKKSGLVATFTSQDVRPIGR